MAKAKYFTQNNEKVYPISHTKAVYDGNGKVLEDRLTEDETAISSLQTDVKGKADKEEVVAVMMEYLKPVLMNIVAQEAFEEGDDSYEI